MDSRNYNPKQRLKHNKILESMNPRCNHCGHDDLLVISVLEEESVTLKCKACNNMFDVQLLLG